MEQQQLIDIGRVEAIRELLDEAGKGFRHGGAFSGAKGGEIHTVQRLWTEGIDFDLVYFPLPHLGYKCVVSVTGELYAALAKPRTLSVVLGLSAKLDLAQVRDLWKGIAAATREQGYESLDLDLVPSRNGLNISISATGETAPLTAGRRMKARSKDLLCVSGSLGAAYLGLQVLERGKKTFDRTGDGSQQDLERNRMLVGAYLKPELDASVVSRLEEAEIYPSCGCLVTRGLADAVKRIARETGLGAKVYADRIPFEGNTFSLGRELDIDPVSAAMNGGDDCRLLFVVPILSLDRFRHDFQTFDIIGHLALPEVGTVLVTPDGVELPMKAQGWPEPEE